MKKFCLSYKTIKWLAILALAALILPLLLLGRYAVPAADDFSYGAPAHVAYTRSGSMLSAAAAAVGKTAESYVSWQGTFSAIFLMALQPAVFGQSLYALTPFIMLASLIAGTFIFCRFFFGDVLGLDRELAAIIAAMLGALSTQFIPSPVQGLYWFNGAVYYVFFHGLLLMACALAIALVRHGGLFRTVLLCLLALMLGGGNYVSALTAAVLAVSGIALLCLGGNRAWRRLILPCIVLLAAFVVSIVAPGNAVRQAAQEMSLGPVQAVLKSFASGADYAVKWFSLPVAGGLVFLCPLIWQSVKSSGCSFRFPALVSAFSYCLLSAMFSPPLYALGNVGEPRLLNIIYFTYLLLLAINLAYWLGWLARHRKGNSQSSLPVVPVLAATLALLLCCGIAMLRGTGFSSLGAVSTMLSGDAAEYHACAMRRFETLEDESIEDAALERFPCLPYLLYFDDITEDPTDWRNVDMSTYFGKSSVVLD